MSDIQNLWPETVGNTNIVMPKEILLKQAQYLSEMTKNLLTVQVRSGRSVSVKGDNSLSHDFIIVAPALGNYQFTLLKVTHDFSIYPLSVIDALENLSYQANNEANFIEILRRIFSGSKTQNAINVIIAQSG